jgi:acyl carrier protein
VKAAVLAALHRVAPEVDPASIRGDRRLRDQVDIDSIDFLNLLLDLDRSLGIEIPESEYGRLETLDDMVAYLSARVPGPAPPPSP